MSLSTDVVIVGAGLAGLMCAKQLLPSGKKITIIYHGDLAQSSSYYAQGGIAGAWLPEDSTDDHISDTLAAGDGLCELAVVEYFCKRAPEFIKYLIDIGVPFDRNADQTFSLTKEGAHRQKRIFHVKDHTGVTIIQTLLATLKDHPQISWVNAPIQGILKSTITGKIRGVKVKNQRLFSPVTVLASGGFSNLFSESTNPKKNTGEGIALAYAAGANMADLEFIQFHPTVFCAKGHPPLLISEALRGEGAFLVNKNNERFMQRYHPLKDLAPRDVVARAIVNEVGVKLNISTLMTTIEQRFPTIFRSLQQRGFDVLDYEIPIQPLVHYTLGGVLASPQGKTSLSGFYAIGECAATGFHGANRLASNSLLEAGLMGMNCGDEISLINDAVDVSERVNEILLPELSSASHVWLGELCRKALGVIRNESQLLNAIEALQMSEHVNHPLFRLFRAILDSALHRKESRGGHFRSDFPSSKASPRHSKICLNSELYHTHL
ncbi:MAG: FAD-dependent oxidoreductase [Candidatus Margulisiibacteriota bacterium]